MDWFYDMKDISRENWIWLPQDKYPEKQSTALSAMGDITGAGYAVAEFRREYSFGKRIEKATLRVSADTSFQLFVGGNTPITGPASVGGDFIGNGTPRENRYSSVVELDVGSDALEIFARVQMRPVQICEYSMGRGGFMLCGVLTLEDGSEEYISTGEDWLVRLNGAYTAPSVYDGSIAPDPYVGAEVVENIWNTTDAPIPVREEHKIIPEGGEITLLPDEKKRVILDFDMIYAGFIDVKSNTEGRIVARLTARELEEDGATEQVTLVGVDEYRTFSLYSAGNIVAELENLSDNTAFATVSLITTHYPVSDVARTTTSDAEINKILRVAEHTLKYCRQTHHLDSPKHMEPLACTGDYYIESLMTEFSFGDMRLSEFDLIRTAELLVREGGRMFHTTYSLIWVRMLYDVYMATGNIALLHKCEGALRLLLQRFEGYIGECGIIDNPPDYMFVDWIYIDEISMHHPPKCLGQACLNMFYYGALKSAEKIYATLGKDESEKRCSDKAKALRKAINYSLYDRERGVYFEGLNTPTPKELVGEWMPENREKRYYLKHSNILAVCFGVCEGEPAREIIHKIMSDKIEGGVQPYFMHFLLEAVNSVGLSEEYTLKIVDKWRPSVRECDKGLVEGFIAPEPTYRFDHSHAWGGTPLYSLPKALIGLEITGAGMNALRLSPSSLGLEYSEVELPTPYGKLTCTQRLGHRTKIKYPKRIELIIEEKENIELLPY